MGGSRQEPRPSLRASVQVDFDEATTPQLATRRHDTPRPTTQWATLSIRSFNYKRTTDRVHASLAALRCILTAHWFLWGSSNTNNESSRLLDLSRRIDAIEAYLRLASLQASPSPRRGSLPASPSPRLASLPASPSPRRSSLPASPSPRRSSVPLHGVNLAGGEFGTLGGPMYQAYIYPEDKSFAYYARQGFRLVRLPFMIERVQPQVFGKLSPADAAHLDRCVRVARAEGMIIVLDAHNYGKRDGNPIDKAHFADFWCRIADRYRGDDHVALGLMNEPMVYDPTSWRKIVDHVLTTLRRKGSKHLVMVPGGGWDGAHDWVSNGNADAFEGFSDSNFMIEVHQYLDGDHSGTHHEEYTYDGGSTRLREFTQWARQRGYRAFLGEFGFKLPAGEREGRALLSYMRANADVWHANAYWAGGPWWGDYPFSIEPTAKGDRPQMALLREFI